MVRSFKAGESPYARAEHQLWCVGEVRNFPHSSAPAFFSFFLLLLLKKKKNRILPNTFFSSGATGGYWLCYSLSGVTVSSRWSPRDARARVSCTGSSTKFPPHHAPPEEWEDRRRGRAQTRLFEWTKEQKARVLPPKWRKTLCQDQNVSLHSSQVSLPWRWTLS